jgi:hypothetical protein
MEATPYHQMEKYRNLLLSRYKKKRKSTKEGQA